jgi:hypothetical protein
MPKQTPHRYVTKIPRTLPAGQVLVHNHVEPQQVIGMNGFQVWTQALDKQVVPCRCAWSGKLHYRVAKAG